MPEFGFHFPSKALGSTASPPSPPTRTPPAAQQCESAWKLPHLPPALSRNNFRSAEQVPPAFPRGGGTGDTEAGTAGRLLRRWPWERALFCFPRLPLHAELAPAGDTQLPRAAWLLGAHVLSRISPFTTPAPHGTSAPLKIHLINKGG